MVIVYNESNVSFPQEQIKIHFCPIIIEKGKCFSIHYMQRVKLFAKLFLIVIMLLSYTL